MTEFLSNGPQEAPRLLLAHGSGAPMDSDFMNNIANLIAGEGIKVLRFEFAYMAGRRTTGKKPPPPKAEKLMSEFVDAIGEVPGDHPVFIGGKSLGARVASMIADEQFEKGAISGLVCLGYPFHPPGRPESLRTAHLQDFSCPAIIAQGENDPFGKRKEVESLTLARSIAFHWCPFGNHDLAPPKRSGRTAEQNWREAAVAVADFIKDRHA